MNTAALNKEVVSLPVEERTLVVESLSQSLNHPETEIDRQWGRVAQKRLDALQKGYVRLLMGKKYLIIFGVVLKNELGKSVCKT